MVAGDPTLRSYTNTLEQNAVSFACLGTSTAETPGFPNIKCPDGLRAQIFFPSCWNGVDLDSPDHKSHVVYPSGTDVSNLESIFLGLPILARSLTATISGNNTDCENYSMALALAITLALYQYSTRLYSTLQILTTCGTGILSRLCFQMATQLALVIMVILSMGKELYTPWALLDRTANILLDGTSQLFKPRLIIATLKAVLLKNAPTLNSSPTQQLRLALFHLQLMNKYSVFWISYLVVTLFKLDLLRR